MGSILYDFLSESFLLDPNMVEEQYASISENALRSELQRYREYCLGHLEDLRAEISGAPMSLRLFAGKPFQQVTSLKQAAFYLDAVVLPDPLFRHTQPASELGNVMAEYLEMSKAEGINRRDLADAATFLNTVRPMVATNYVRFFPISFYSEPPSQIPLLYSPTQFAELLPQPILEHYRHAAKVTSLARQTDGWIVEDELHLGRGIAIQFQDEDLLHFFNLFAQKVVRMDEESRIVHFVMSLPDTPPSPEEFAIWVTQSVNSAARAHFDALRGEVALAAQCDAMYLTNSAFAASGLDSHTDAAHNLHTDMTRFVLDVEVPFFRNVTVEDLMHARADGEAFDLFRRELEKQFRELRLEKDPQKLQMKLENAIHELTEVQETKVAQTINRLRKELAADTALALAGLAGTVATSGLSLLAAILLGVKGYKTFTEYQKSIHENPAYFLWKVKHS